MRRAVRRADGEPVQRASEVAGSDPPSFGLLAIRTRAA